VPNRGAYERVVRAFKWRTVYCEWIYYKNDAGSWEAEDFSLGTKTNGVEGIDVSPYYSCLQPVGQTIMITSAAPIAHFWRLSL
jgi:hypothetical protein